MAFNQTALAEIAVQTVSGSNLYSYFSDDALADVTAADYFEQSQYAGTDGWENGFIFCVLGDGSYIIQIGAGGSSGSQFGAGGTDVSTLINNVRGAVIVNMGGGDYTLSDTEAQSAILSVFNEGSGSTLTFPTSSNGFRPAITTIGTTFCTNSFIVECQSGGSSISLGAGSIFSLITDAGSGVINTTSYSNINARGKSNGVRTESTIAGNIDDADKGKLIKCTNAAATTLTVLSTMATNDFVCDAVSTGAGGVTIVGDGTSVVTGTTTLATGAGCKIWRDGSTQNFICV